MTLYVFQKMSCIYIKLKDIHKVVLYFDSLQIFYGIYIYILYIYIFLTKTYGWDDTRKALT